MGDVGGRRGNFGTGGNFGNGGAGVLCGFLTGSLIGSLNGFWRRSGTSCGTVRGGIIFCAPCNDIHVLVGQVAGFERKRMRRRLWVHSL